MFLSPKGSQMRPLVKKIYTHKAEQSPEVGQKSKQQRLLCEKQICHRHCGDEQNAGREAQATDCN